MWMDYEGHGEAPRNALVQLLGLGLSAASLASYWLNSNKVRPLSFHPFSFSPLAASSYVR